LILVDQPSPLV